MAELQSQEASSASNHVALPDSPYIDIEDSTYGTPENDLDTSSPVMNATGKDKDPQLVVGAGRSLRTMLVDLMGVLETQANAQVFIQGDITLRVEGRETYKISLFNPDALEPSDLKVKIDKASAKSTAPHFPNGTTPETSNKRQREDRDATVDLTEDVEGTPKRVRVDSGHGEGDAQSPVQEVANAPEEEASDPAPSGAIIPNKLQNISAQIKWVEECRRIADEAHDRREETWRSTSATFHDETRKVRERHEAWMAQEMTWQRNTLMGMINDLKGLYPLGHSLKWETPPTLLHASPPIPMPTQPTYRYVANKRPIPKSTVNKKS
ncbi:hypothetical protein EJ08DRAFT_698253 [Tothia fuscella]|uniref:Uncharacterized protein n=1 Tax=Tothia fuscella TaxID=1048955 RepID=A0A9P4NQ01_9PEZI|nr:hypothetical protein EJ08DRAFT_698253 [Tothia fuscella]